MPMFLTLSYAKKTLTSSRLCKPHAHIGPLVMTVQGCKCLFTTRHNKKRGQYQLIAPAYLHGAHHEDVTRIMDEK